MDNTELTAGLSEQPIEVIEYKLVFQMGNPSWSSQHNECIHKNNFTEIWDEVPWETVEKITFDHGVIDRYQKLKTFEETKCQPVRNVRLFNRVIRPTPWEPYQG